MSTDYKNSAYDKLADDASRDDRVGNHDFYVSEVISDTWDSGDPRIKVRGKLLTAGSAFADLTLSPPPPPEVVAAEAHTWDREKKRAIGMNVNMFRQLADLYQITDPATQITEGMIFRVKTGKGKGGFVRVIQFKPKSEISKMGVETSAAPF